MIAALPFMTLGFKGIDVGGQCWGRFLPALRMEGEYVYDCSASFHDPRLQGIDVVCTVVSATAGY